MTLHMVTSIFAVYFCPGMVFQSLGSSKPESSHARIETDTAVSPARFLTEKNPFGRGRYLECKIIVGDP